MASIIIPIALLSVLGIVAAVMLTVAAKVMYVPVDERIEALSEALPGANCGGCGFAGCSDYATAIVENGAELTLCPVGGAGVVAKLGEIMGVEVSAGEEKCAIVMCGGYKDKTSTILQYADYPTCKASKTLFGGAGACQHGCLGLGDCVASCSFDAIRVIDGVAWVDRELCFGCGSCVKACPNGIIKIVPKKNTTYVKCSSTDKGAVTRKACSAGCIGCKKCEKVCKFDAIKVENNNAVIDPDKCKNCGLCAKECPTGAILKLPKKKKVVAPKAE